MTRKRCADLGLRPAAFLSIMGEPPRCIGALQPLRRSESAGRRLNRSHGLPSDPLLNVFKGRKRPVASI